MEKTQIEIDIKITSEDFERSLFWHDRIKIIGLSLVILAFIIFIIFGLIILLLDPNTDTSVLILLPIFIPTLIFAFLLYSIFRNIKNQSKQIEENSEETKYVFDEEGFEASSISTTVKTSWKKLHKIVENKTDFLFFPQENIFFPIPKYFFENENQVEVLRGLIKENLGNDAKLLG